MGTAAFIAAAAVDPYVKADEVIAARPGEVATLADAFSAAATAMSESGNLSLLAIDLADRSASFDGAAPSALMDELVAVRDSIEASPADLATIGGSLGELAGRLSSVQLTVCDVLASMEADCTALAVQRDAAVLSAVPGSAETAAALLAEGIAVVHAADAAVRAAVDEYDSFVDGVLAALQSVGYLISPLVDAGIDDAIQGTDSAGGLPAPPPAASAPAAFAGWWESLTPQQQARYLQQHGDLVAAMPGLPSAVYDIVNRRDLSDAAVTLASEEYASAEALMSSGLISDSVAEAFGITSAADIYAMSSDDLAELALILGAGGDGYVISMLDRRGERIAVHDTQDSVNEKDGVPRYLLEFDLDSFDRDGTAVIAIGEVDRADNVAVVVQGATHDLASISGQTHTAESVRDMMNETGGDDTNAVIVYEGYDNPAVYQAPLPQQAIDGGAALAADIESWEASHVHESGQEAHTTVIGHSYGTVVTSYALRDGANEIVDDVVLYGSPGVVVDQVEGLGVDGDGEHVFTAMDDTDLLRIGDFIDEQVPFGDPIFGPPPADPAFGATIVSTEGVNGHGDYFGYEDGKPTDTLYSAGAVAAGEYDKVRSD